MSLTPDQYRAASELINAHQRILITPHANVDPDGLSSALACYHLFTALGKDVTVVCPETPPESLEFLPAFSSVVENVDDAQNFIITVNLSDGIEVDKLRYTVEDNKVNIIVVPKNGRIESKQVGFEQGDWHYDLIVTVDTADMALLGSLLSDHRALFDEVPILNVDHHISNTKFGQLQLIDPTAASATEVLYGWFKQDPQMLPHLTADVATLLLTGLITDTRSFQNPNTTPHSLEVAAELLNKGARQQEIIRHIYKTKPLSTLQLWGRALNRIQIDEAAGIVWTSIAKSDLDEFSASSRETHGLLDELISTIPSGQVHVMFTELEDGGLKASMRSSDQYDSSAIAAATYGGGGHARAAGFRVKDYSNFDVQVLECIQKIKQAMQGGSTPTTAPSTPVATPAAQASQTPAEPTPAAPPAAPSSPPAPPAAPSADIDVVSRLQGQQTPDQSPPSTPTA